MMIMERAGRARLTHNKPFARLSLPMRQFSLRLAFLSSAGLVLLLGGCGRSSTPGPEDSAKASPSRSAAELARGLAKQDQRCAYDLGECLHAAQNCYQSDRPLPECAQGFANCKSQDIAPACALNRVSNLALQEALNCWVALDDLARAGYSEQVCLGALEGCLEEAQRSREEKSPGQCGPDSCVPGPEWPSDQDDWPGNQKSGEPDDSGG